MKEQIKEIRDNIEKEAQNLKSLLKEVRTEDRLNLKAAYSNSVIVKRYLDRIINGSSTNNI